MEKEFVPYTEALELKALGFDEPYLGYYAGDILCTGQPREIHLDKDGNYKKTKTESYPIVFAPTYSAAFRWFREKYELIWEHSFYDSQIQLYVGEITYPDNSLDFFKSIEVEYNGYNKAFEEAELECLKKLIEIVKEKL